MGAAIGLVFLFVTVLSVVVIVGRFRFNAKIAKGRAVPSGRRTGPDGGPRVPGVDTYESGRSVRASDVLRYSEDGIYRAGRAVGISVGVFTLATSSGIGSSTTRATTWSGPEFLIGTKHPLELQQAVRDALDSYHLAGGHPIPVQLPEAGRSSE